MNMDQIFCQYKDPLMALANRNNGELEYREFAKKIGVSDDESIQLIRRAKNTQTTNDSALILEQSIRSKPESINKSTQSMVAYGISEFLGLDLPARECLLSPWLTRQGLAMAYAPRGIGKTFFALGVAYACATAGTFLGWNSETACRVVYIDGEMPAATMQERLRAMVEADPREHAPDALDGLQIVSQEKQEPAMPDLSSIEGQRLFDQVTDNADLVIIDNISTLCRAGAENKSDDWNVVSDWALRMRRHGKTVLFIHHAGKGGQQRGTSKREDILDVVIALRRPLDDAQTGASFEVHFEKARHLFGEDTKSFVASLNDGLWKIEAIEDNTYKRVISLANEGMTVTEIAKELDRAKSNISRHLKKAKESGDILGGAENSSARAKSGRGA